MALKIKCFVEDEIETCQPALLDLNKYFTIYQRYLIDFENFPQDFINSVKNVRYLEGPDNQLSYNSISTFFPR